LEAEGVCGVLVELCGLFVFLRLAAEEGETGAGGRVCSFGLELSATLSPQISDGLSTPVVRGLVDLGPCLGEVVEGGRAGNGDAKYRENFESGHASNRVFCSCQLAWTTTILDVSNTPRN
jgi:hypothetical protein